MQTVIVQGFACTGQGASWKLDASRTTALLTTPDEKGRKEHLFRGFLQPVPELTPRWLVWRGSTTRLPAETLVATVRQESCRTGADVPARDWRTVLTFRTGSVLSGCCVVHAGYDAAVAPVAEPAGKTASDWARSLPALLPALRRCIADGGPTVDRVLVATTTAPGTISVRLQDRDGRTFQCTSARDGRSKATIVPMADTPAGGGGANPVFYPIREQPPLVSCGRLERVFDGRRTVAGYLHYEPC